MVISADLERELDEKGFAKIGDIGGQPKQTYWTPDGRMMRVMPDIHEYTRRDAKGKVIESGMRDANLDKGWLTSKPVKLQLRCPNCDLWHETQAEVNDCGVKKKALIAKYTRKAKKELKQSDDGRIDKLEADMTEIKGLLRKLVEKV